MNEESTVAELRRAMDVTTRDHHLDAGIAGAAWIDAHGTRRRPALRTGIVVAASMTVVAGFASALALIHHRDATIPAAAGSSACAGNVSTTSLPTWARSGFSPSDQRVVHVMSDGGEIVGIPFGTLRVHQPAGTNNKILWVAKAGGGTLRIKARLEGSNLTETRAVHLGPSFVDLPAPGCWRMTLTWSGRRDTIALRYR